MPAILYFSEVNRTKAIKDLRPIIEDMAQNQIYLALCLILDGMDVYEAIDKANSIPKIRYR